MFLQLSAAYSCFLVRAKLNSCCLRTTWPAKPKTFTEKGCGSLIYTVYHHYLSTGIETTRSNKLSYQKMLIYPDEQDLKFPTVFPTVQVELKSKKLGEKVQIYGAQVNQMLFMMM